MAISAAIVSTVGAIIVAIIGAWTAWTARRAQRRDAEPGEIRELREDNKKLWSELESLRSELYEARVMLSQVVADREALIAYVRTLYRWAVGGGRGTMPRPPSHIAKIVTGDEEPDPGPFAFSESGRIVRRDDRPA